MGIESRKVIVTQTVEKTEVSFPTLAEAEASIHQMAEHRRKAMEEGVVRDIAKVQSVYQACALLHGVGIDNAIPDKYYPQEKTIEIPRDKLPLIRQAVGSMRVCRRQPVQTEVKRGRPKIAMWIFLSLKDYPGIELKYMAKPTASAKCTIKTVTSKSRQLVCG